LVGNTIDENEAGGTTVGILSTTDPNLIDIHTYTLVSGTGDTDNASFQTSGDELQSSISLNFESQSAFSVRIRSTDYRGEFTEKSFAITAVNVDDTPENLLLDGGTVVAVDENLAAGQSLGTLVTTDQDNPAHPSGWGAHTYSLPAGVLDNDSFTIDGDEVKTGEVFDFEGVQNIYDVRVRTTDGGGEFFDKDMVVNINDKNDLPTDITRSTTADIPENQPNGTVVNTLTTTDEDASETFTYTLVTGTDDDDNAFFQISGDELQIKDTLNFERAEGATFKYRLRTTDSGAGSYDEAFTVTVTDVDDPPRDVFLGSNEIVEGKDVGTVIGFFVANDDDGFTDSHTFNLVPGTGSDDNPLFQLNSTTGEFKSGAIFNFASKSTYTVRVRATDVDDAGLFIEKIQLIQVLPTGSNAQPVDIALDNTELLELTVSGSLVGNLTTIDPDPGDTHTYALIAGTGDTDNASFTITGNQLFLNTSLDFDIQSVYSILIETDDGSAGRYSEIFNIVILEFINTPPTDVTLSASNVDETVASGTTVGSFSSTDPDPDESFTYSFIAGTGDEDNGSFSITDADLFTNTTFDYLVKNSYSIRIQVEDSNGGLFEISFTIDINDTRPPTISVLSPADDGVNITKSGDLVITFNERVNVATGNIRIVILSDETTIETIPVDGNLLSGDGTATITINPVSDLNGTVEYYITIGAGTFTDLAGNSFSGWSDNVTWNFTTENTDPTDITITNTTVDETAASGTTVGDLGAVDEDPDQVFTYSLVAGDGDSDNGSFAIAGVQLNTNDTFNFLTKDSYTVRVQVNDGFGGSFEEIIIITILDTRAPLVSSYTPANSSIDVDKSTNLTIVFNEPVNVGTGDFRIIQTSSSTTKETIDVTSANVSGSGTATIVLDPTNDLDGGVSYYIEADTGVLSDIDGNDFTGISSTTEWSFTTYDDVNPIIVYEGTLPSHLTQGSSEDVAVNVTDVSAVNVSFHYGGILTPMNQLAALAATKDGDNYSVTVDDSFFDNIGLKFYFYAEDANGNSETSDVRFMFLALTTSENVTGLKFGGKIEHYQILAIPYVLNNSDILNLFSEFGEYDDTKWRLVRYSNEKSRYEDFPAFRSMEIGKGYWFNAKEKRDIVLGDRQKPAVTTEPDNGFRMALRQGWNQIGNPFTVALNWNQVLTANNITDEVQSLWVYSGGGNLTAGTSLSPFEGGFVKANQTITLNLFPGDATGLRKFDNIMLANDTDAEAWMIPLTLENEEITYESGYFGMHPESLDSYDQYDLSRPPHFLKHMDYYFEVENDLHTGHMVQSSEEFIYDLTVDTNIEPGFITLRWPDKKIGPDTEMFLFDVDKQKLVDMKEFNQYGFYQDGKKEFRIYYNVDPESIIPDIALLGSAYPNPFDKTTIIPFSLPEDKDYQISLKVSDVLGNEVNTLIEGEYQMGFHEVRWNGDNFSGKKAEAGIYVIQLLVIDEKKTEIYTSRVILQ